jgi:hypothetical protein
MNSEDCLADVILRHYSPSHFGQCPPIPVDDESDFRHRTRLGFDGVELTSIVSHLILDS